MRSKEKRVRSFGKCHFLAIREFTALNCNDSCRATSACVWVLSVSVQLLALNSMTSHRTDVLWCWWQQQSRGRAQWRCSRIRIRLHCLDAMRSNWPRPSSNNRSGGPCTSISIFTNSNNLFRDYGMTSGRYHSKYFFFCFSSITVWSEGHSFNTNSTDIVSNCQPENPQCNRADLFVFFIVECWCSLFTFHSVREDIPSFMKNHSF